ncbi:hypothetical protein [Paucibacter soli]|uniref:hypothetical protein n=1 Tax=Paucibacter soli TaxID=3133433 RepID=UPI0030A47971
MSMNTDFPTDLAGIERLKECMAEQPTLDLAHGFIIRCINWLGPDLKVDLVMARFAIKTCHEFISRGVPCRNVGGPVRAAAVHLLGNNWPEALRAEIADLMRAYVKAGYFLLNDREDAFGAGRAASSTINSGRTPLEVAIRRKNLTAAEILVEAGDRLDHRPVPGHAKEDSLIDLIALANHVTDGPEFGLRLLEVARAGHGESPVTPATRRSRTP